VSPWAYERIQRWNAAGGRSQPLLPRSRAGAPEAAALMQPRERAAGQSWLLHIDLHETTDTDESEFRPALAARDGKPFEPGTIPDGFYLVDDERQSPARVSGRDHRGGGARSPTSRPADAEGTHHRLARWWRRAWSSIRSLRSACAPASAARATPPPPRSIPTARAPRRSSATTAQVAAVRAAIDFALAHS
jgi:hypothetical protein